LSQKARGLTRKLFEETTILFAPETVLDGIENKLPKNMMEVQPQDIWQAEHSITNSSIGAKNKIRKYAMGQPKNL
jgi:hypothetical protein